MTKDEKIIYYNKIEAALLEEYPVLKEGLTKTQITELIENDRWTDKVKELIISMDEPVTVEYLEPDLLAVIKVMFKKDNTITEAFPIEIDENIIVDPINSEVTFKYGWLGLKDYTVKFPRPVLELIDSPDNSYIKKNKNTFTLLFTNMESKEIKLHYKNTEEN